LKNAYVLILDEETSDLDSTLEKEVQKSIENLDSDYAIIGIAHRLSTVQNADRIYTVSSGGIIEVGRHEELIKNEGQYAKLHNVQSQDSFGYK
jgi:subfamily B ATP-binding cassette protein MsbA